MQHAATSDVAFLSRLLFNYGRVVEYKDFQRTISFKMLESTMNMVLKIHPYFEGVDIKISSQHDETCEINWSSKFTLSHDKSMEVSVDHISSKRTWYRSPEDERVLYNQIFASETDDRIIQSLHLMFNLRRFQFEGDIKILKMQAAMARMFIQENEAAV